MSPFFTVFFRRASLKIFSCGLKCDSYIAKGPSVMFGSPTHTFKSVGGSDYLAYSTRAICTYPSVTEALCRLLKHEVTSGGKVGGADCGVPSAPDRSSPQ